MHVNHRKGLINIIAVYVDDLLIASSDCNQLHGIKVNISRGIEVVDKAPVNNFLSMKGNRDGEAGSISIGQKEHIRELLNDFGMNESRSIATPLDIVYQVNYNAATCKKVDQVQYQSLIGSLMFLAIYTRPDILHSVCKSGNEIMIHMLSI